jgi:hypothetical protein
MIKELNYHDFIISKTDLKGHIIYVNKTFFINHPINEED